MSTLNNGKVNSSEAVVTTLRLLFLMKKYGVNLLNIKDLIKLSKLQKIKFEPIDLSNNGIGGGIYRMYDVNNEIIYVGKSSDLHRRLHQHIGKHTNTAYFIDEAKRFEWHVENDPVYQTMLEGLFIAYHRPKYNDEVKDAKRLFGAGDDPR